MKIKAKHILLLGAFIVLTLLGYKILPRDEIVIQSNQEEEEKMFSGNQEKIEMIFVHIEGAVNFPGIKEVLKGTRLFEAIEIAGGITPDADTSKINLASILKDEQKIYIPFQISEDDSKQILNHEYETSKNENKIINLNYATEEDLQQLEGIGPAMAKKIVDYRDSNGYFNSIEELQNVSGIGEAKFNKIKEFITI